MTQPIKSAEPWKAGTLAGACETGSLQDNRYFSPDPTHPSIAGQVNLTPENTRIKYYSDFGGPKEKQISRRDVFLHEWFENFERTETGLPYSKKYDPDVAGGKGAHEIAGDNVPSTKGNVHVTP